jgi:tetratricopeptide (TPR) repeat protein
MTFPRRVARALCFASLLTACAAGAQSDPLLDAQRLFKQGQMQPALDKAEQVLAAKPRDAQARFLKGLILTEMGRAADAVAVFVKLTEDYPELPEPYNNLAVIYAQQKQFEKAKNALEMAIRTHPSYATAHENLGDVYARMASQAYDKALQLDSSNAAAQSKLALIRELISIAPRPSAARAPAAGDARPVALSTPAPASAAKADGTRVTLTAAAPAAPAAPASPAAAAPPAPARAEPVKPQAEAAPNSAAEREVSQAVRDWAAAWSRKDVKGYLGFYAREFKPPGGETRSTWERERQKRIDKPGKIDIEIEGLEVRIGGKDQATARFRQNYRSATLQTSSRKSLDLVRREGRWLIRQERVGG